MDHYTGFIIDGIPNRIRKKGSIYNSIIGCVCGLRHSRKTNTRQVLFVCSDFSLREIAVGIYKHRPKVVGERIHPSVGVQRWSAIYLRSPTDLFAKNHFLLYSRDVQGKPGPYPQRDIGLSPIVLRRQVSWVYTRVIGPDTAPIPGAAPFGGCIYMRFRKVNDGDKEEL